MEQQIKTCDRCKRPGNLRKLNHLDLWLCLGCRPLRDGTLTTPCPNIAVACQMYELRRSGPRGEWLPPFYIMRKLFKDPELSFADIAVRYGKSKEGIARIHRIFFSGWVEGQSTGLERRGVAADGRFAAQARKNFHKDPDFAPLISWARKFSLEVELVPVRWGRNKTGYSKYLVRVEGLLCKLHRVTTIHQGYWRMLVGRLDGVNIAIGQIGDTSPRRFFIWPADGLKYRQHLDILASAPASPTPRSEQVHLHENAVQFFSAATQKKKMAKASLSAQKLPAKGSVA